MTVVKRDGLWIYNNLIFMSVTLPTASEATIESEAAIAAATTLAQNSFVAEVTVLINQAVINGLYFVQPIAVNLVTPAFVTGYFQPLGYTVLFPALPTFLPNPAFIPGTPEVLPPGYVPPYSDTQYQGPPRYNISWPSS